MSNRVSQIETCIGHARAVVAALSALALAERCASDDHPDVDDTMAALTCRRNEERLKRGAFVDVDADGTGIRLEQHADDATVDAAIAAHKQRQADRLAAAQTQVLVKVVALGDALSDVDGMTPRQRMPTADNEVSPGIRRADNEPPPSA